MPLVAKAVVEVSPDAHWRFTISPTGDLLVTEIEPDGNERLTILPGDTPFLLARFIMGHHNMMKMRQSTAARREQDDPDPPEIAIEKTGANRYQVSFRAQVMALDSQALRDIYVWCLRHMEELEATRENNNLV